MKVLINGLQLNKRKSGVQYYTKELFESISKIQKNNTDIHLIRINRGGAPVLENNHYVKINKSRIGRILFEHLSLPKYLYRSNYNLYHATNYILPFIIQLPTVLTIHDLISIEFPKLCQIGSAIYFKLFLGRSIKKTNKIIAVSHQVKKDIIKKYSISNEKIEVIYHGINPRFKKISEMYRLNKVTSMYKLPSNYILFVGNIEPKKNLERLIQAFYNLVVKKGISHKLVIAGKRGWKYSGVFKTVRRLKMTEKIIFTGYVPEMDLPALYSMADLFVFPSLYEGFGLPPLEAMACEVPVLVSDKGALPEVTGGNAYTINPYSINAIENGIYTMLMDHDLRKKYILAGKKWIKGFTWGETARKTLDLYNRTLYKTC